MLKLLFAILRLLLTIPLLVPISVLLPVILIFISLESSILILVSLKLVFPSLLFLVLLCMEQKTMRRRFKRFFSSAGERIKQNYSASRLGDGVIRLLPADTLDIQEYIDSFAESCSIEHILALCAAGDTSVLSRAQGAFIDTTILPKTFREMLDVVIEGRSKFDSLPVEIKQKFDNDFERWFSEAGSESWISNMGLDQPDNKETKEVKINAES